MISIIKLLFLLIASSFGVLSNVNNVVASDDLLITSENITAYLYTRTNLDTPDTLHTDDLSDLNESHFDSSLPNYFAFHGANNNYLSTLYIKDPLLNATDVNLFLVDYSGPASLNRTVRAEVLEKTGQIVADYINLILDEYHIELDSVTLVGFSMGTQVSGQIGKLFNGTIGTIVALDPSNIAPIIIDSSRARFVHAVHTSTVGIQTQVGHADYFANMNDQPGCDGNNTCNHIRATRYYGESLSTGGFTALKCDSRESFLDGLCDDNEKSYLGGVNLDKNANGTYYLSTNSEPPFSQG